MRAAPQHVLARLHMELHQQIVGAGPASGGGVVYRLDVAAGVERHAPPHGRQKALRRRLRGRFAGARKRLFDRILQLLAHPLDHRIGDDGAGDLVHIEEQREHAGHRERARHRDREMRHAAGAELVAERPHHEDHVEDGREEEPEDGLDLSIGDEADDQSWAELVRRERQGDEGQRDDERRHRDDAGQQRRKEVARALGVAAIDPERALRRSPGHARGQHEVAEREPGEAHPPGHQPQARAHQDQKIAQPVHVTVLSPDVQSSELAPARSARRAEQAAQAGAGLVERPST
ncbi:MAG TPA: hypothetical protein VIL72_11905 [Beijerinckiaceae bacterium]